MTRRSSQGEPRPSAFNPTKAASAVNEPTVSTSPWANWITSSTPKNNVKPTATRAYIMPSISPFMMYCAISPASIWRTLHRHARRRAGHRYLEINESVDGRANKPGHHGRRKLFLSRQLALSARVLAVGPFDELAVLNHVFRNHGHGILPVIVEGDLADDGIAVLHIRECRNHFLTVGPDLVDSVEDQVHRGKSEWAIGLGRVRVVLRVVLLHEVLTARQLLGRRALPEGERAL